MYLMLTWNKIMNFKSDNIGPISPEIIQAIIEANSGNQSSYGADDYTFELKKRMSEIFETDVIVFLTSTGTAANSLALSSLVKPYETIYCSPEAHINIDECGAPEFYTGGAKLVIIDSDVNGKINLHSLNEKIIHSLSLRPHGQKPGCISITQATECGTIYTIEELTAIHNIAKKYNIPVHMDGARFANSLISLNCKPAESTWKAGVDVLSFGATKNGAMCAEAIVFFNHQHAENFDYLHKRAGQLMSKARFFSCQFLAYLKQDLWLENAKKANFMCKQLAKIFNKHNIELIYPVEANEIFVTLSVTCVNHLRENHCGFYDWSTSKVTTGLYRFVTSCFTSNAEIMDLDACLNTYAKISANQ
jgi:threonine aldolase